MSKKLFSLLLLVAGMSLIAFFVLSREIYSSAKSGKPDGKPGKQLIIAHTEIFGRLERPHVFFDHARHSEAYEKEGCETCHPAVTEEDLFFEHPFKAVRKDEESVKNAYHEKCINCHQKRSDEKKKSGPVTCGECHVRRSVHLESSFPVVEFDFAHHDQHVGKLKSKCDPCHHSYDKEEKELVYEQGTEQSCTYCHDDKKKSGPSLAAERGLIEEKGLTMRKVSHARCVNCHLFYLKKGLKAGPLQCSRCHTGQYKSIQELMNVPRPDRDQPKKPFITIEDGKMKGVLFDHAYHEKNSRTCRECHHETLNACKKCHGLAGSPEGNRINVSGAYHNTLSHMGCAGCHRIKKSGKDCAGCHRHLLDIDLRSKGPQKSVCAVCHSGKREGMTPVGPIAISGLRTEKVPEKVTIKILEKEYKPSEFPHRKVVQKLIEISNESKMATYFHRNMQTICEGCHHQSRADAEAVKGKPPYCRNCHSITFDIRNLNRPRLLAAYHRQCLGCHEKMRLKQTGCKDCHKERGIVPKSILSGPAGLQEVRGG